MNIIKSSATLIFLTAVTCFSHAQENIEETSNVKTARYRVTFTSLWDTDAHLGRPASAHFSPLVVTTHKKGHALYQMGDFASPGLEDVAELGQTSSINQEIESDIERGLIGETLNTSNQFVPRQPQQVFEITVSSDFTHLSLVTMIAPSPDWIVGLENFELYNEGEFLEETGPLALYAINAGTEEGDFGGNFSLSNSASQPHQPIAPLLGPGFETPFATVTIERMD